MRSEGGLELRVWGRRLRFGRGPLPAEITSQGLSLLSAPLQFAAQVDGAPVELTWSAPEVVAETPASVRLRSTGASSGLSAIGETVVEDDGMIRVALEVSAARPLRLDGWSYEIRLSPSLGETFFNHHVEYDYRTLNVDKARMLEAAGAVPRTARRFAFVPTFFVGNREVGIEWWSESDADWSSPARSRPIELRRDSEAATLRIEPITSSLPLAPGAAWRDEFALFPTPMRPPAPGAQDTRFLPWEAARRFGDPSGIRFAWIAFGSAFRARWHGLPASFDDDPQRALRRRLHEAGVRYVPYGKLTVAPTLHPETLRRFSEWSADGRWFTSAPPGDERAVLESNGVRLRPRQGYTYAVCMGERSYLDWMLGENLRTFASERLGGLYFDHGAITRMCLRSPRVAGKRGRQIWEYFAVRDFYRRLYIEMKRIDPEALLVVHSHGQPRALAAYADFTFVGEALNVAFLAGHDWEAVARNPGLYRPDYSALPEGYLEAMLLPRIGGLFGLLPQIKPALDPRDPSRARAFQRAMLGRTLVGGVPVWLANADLDAMIEVYQALDRFGALEGAVFHPWWSNQARIGRDPRLRVSAYVRGRRALLIAANWGDEELAVAVELDPALLGVSEPLRVRDLERPGPRFAAKGTSFEVRVPPRDFRLLLVDR